MSKDEMETQIIEIDRKRIDDSDILPAAEAILSGKIVVFPTETVYGVGCRYDDESARERIFALKKRDRSKPLGVYLFSTNEITNHASLSTTAKLLAKAFLPGPLTLVLPGRRGGSVGIRVPSDDVCRRLIQLSGIPLSGTSANLSGRESPTDGRQAIAAMERKVGFIIDAGRTELARPSTVIDLFPSPPVVLREGAVPLDEISRVLGYEVGKAF
jgi:L-threonylcarbamoyladenylate synthase